MQDKVSVIVPVYNGEEYLENTVKNLLESTYQSLEIILIDDGSVDGSFAICKKMEQQDERIKVFHQENQGIVAARNRGLEEATGKYICFCDQDDIVPRKAYNSMIDMICKKDVDMCLCSTAKYAGQQIIDYEIYKNNVWNKEEIINNLVLPLYFDGFTTSKMKIERRRVTGTIWKCMIRRQIIEDHNIIFRRFVNFEDDLFFFLDVLSHCRNVATLDEIGYYWRMNQNSETYRWKYINNLKDKEERYYDYMDNLLEKFGVDDKVRAEYRIWFRCNHIVNMIDNEGSPDNHRLKKERLKYLKKTIYTDQFSSIKEGISGVEWGYLKKKIILKLVSVNMLTLAYYFNIVYRNIKKNGVRFRIWSDIEKILRRK